MRPHPGAILIRHDARCTACRYGYYVWAAQIGGNWTARCAEPQCGAFRDNLDVARYGADLGLPAEAYLGRDTSRFEQSRGQRKVTRAVADGECVHCVLARTVHVTRRGAVPIPRTWLDVPPIFQASLFHAFAPAEELQTASLSELAGSERDHILQRQLHEKIAPGLSSEQAVFVRRHWVVPSCRQHNEDRAYSLEPLPYLMHVFALFLAAKDLSIADNVAETHLFVDAVKAAHLVLRMQAVAAAERRA